tara:strand:- start:31 stop:195 length:165 start_codon:yes stop_codon:yes gene_type:complete
MARTYKFFKNTDGDTIGVFYDENNERVSIPLADDNTDYQEYLEWAKTNTTEAAD